VLVLILAGHKQPWSIKGRSQSPSDSLARRLESDLLRRLVVALGVCRLVALRCRSSRNSKLQGMCEGRRAWLKPSVLNNIWQMVLSFRRFPAVSTGFGAIARVVSCGVAKRRWKGICGTLSWKEKFFETGNTLGKGRALVDFSILRSQYPSRLISTGTSSALFDCPYSAS